MEAEGIEFFHVRQNSRASEAAVHADLGEQVAMQRLLSDHRFIAKRVRQTTVWKGLLRIGQSLQIPIKCHSKTHTATVPHGRRPIQAERTVGRYRQNEEFVGGDRLIKAYRYGPDYIPVSTVQDMENVDDDLKGMDILGFGLKKQLDRASLLSVVHLFVADGEQGDCASNALTKGMLISDRVALARWMKSDGKDALLMYLVPSMGSEEHGRHACLYGCMAPFPTIIEDGHSRH